MNKEIISRYNTIEELRDYAENVETKMNERASFYSSRLISKKIVQIDSAIKKVFNRLFGKEVKDGLIFKLKFVSKNKEKSEHKYIVKIDFFLNKGINISKQLKELTPLIYCGCPAFKFSGSAYYLWLQQMMHENNPNILLKPPEKKWNNKLICKHIASILYDPIFETKIKDHLNKSEEKQISK